MVGAFDLLKPTRVEVEKLGPRLARVTVEPLERGFGYTLGNALRRILLSSIPGAAIVECVIDGVLHEYSTIDITQFFAQSARHDHRLWQLHYHVRDQVLIQQHLFQTLYLWLR